MHFSTYNKTIRTVSEINREIQQLIEGQFHFVRIIGEISTIRRPHSGHYYFILKDEHAQIKAVLFKNQQRYLPEELKDGQQVVCDGRLSVYEPRGEYQIIIDTIDFHGAGQLQIAFDNLKHKLKSLGFFEQSRKRLLPSSVNTIVLITSPGGAAVHDFLSVCRRRKVSLHVQLLPVPVQGEGCAERICEAIRTAHTLNPDVIVLCRGGGSLEDLWAFNDEQLAHVLFNASIPIVTGIGHETDFTIADFCADMRGATPTAAAELIVPDGGIYRDRVNNLLARMRRTCHYRFESVSQRLGRINRFLASFDSAFYRPTLRLDAVSSRLLRAITSKTEQMLHLFSNLEQRLHHCVPSQRILSHQTRLSHLSEKMQQSMAQQLNAKMNNLQRAAAVLDSLSPLATLARGYSIVTSSNAETRQIITDVDQLEIDDEIAVTLHRGQIRGIVTSKRR